MGRRWGLSVVAVALVALVGPSAAWAGGTATVRLDEPPGAVVAGEPLRLGFMVMQHDVHPFEGAEPLLTALHRETGESVEAEGRPEGEPGHYVVEVTFPEDGAWTWEILPRPFLGSTSFPPLEVLDATAGAAAVHPAHVFAGSCAGGDPKPHYPLGEVGLPEATGAKPGNGVAPGVAVKRGAGEVAVGLEALLAAPHGVVVGASAAEPGRAIACGDIAGVSGTEGLLVGLVERGGSGYAGVAELRPDGARTAVTVFLARGLAGEVGPEAEVADAGTGAAAAVEIAAMSFGPQLLEVEAGTTVTWTNRDSVAHEVNFEDAEVDDSGLLDPGAAHAQTFAVPGTYTYRCGPHPGMTGTLVVL